MQRSATNQRSGIECVVCGKRGASREEMSSCGSCRGVTYCGRDCQRRDWAAHRVACAPGLQPATSASALAESGFEWRVFWRTTEVRVSEDTRRVNERDEDWCRATVEGIGSMLQIMKSMHDSGSDSESSEEVESGLEIREEFREDRYISMGYEDAGLKIRGADRGKRPKIELKVRTYASVGGTLPDGSTESWPQVKGPNRELWHKVMNVPALSDEVTCTETMSALYDTLSKLETSLQCIANHEENLVAQNKIKHVRSAILLMERFSKFDFAERTFKKFQVPVSKFRAQARICIGSSLIKAEASVLVVKQSKWLSICVESKDTRLVTLAIHMLLNDERHCNEISWIYSHVPYNIPRLAPELGYPAFIDKVLTEPDSPFLCKEVAAQDGDAPLQDTQPGELASVISAFAHLAQ